MARTLLTPVLLAIFTLMLLQSPGVTHAWQLGGYTTDSLGEHGVRAEQLISGNVPNPYFFAAMTAFTDSSNVWHEIGLLEVSNGGSLEIQAEWNDGNYHDVVLCTGLSRGTYYDDQIFWSASLGEFLYKTVTTSCNTLALVESGTPTINSGGSTDFMESNDNTASDFQNSKAYAYYTYTMNWYSSGSWYPSSTGISLNSGDAPSSIGLLMTCSSGSSAHLLTTKVDSPYAPPPAQGAYVVSC